MPLPKPRSDENEGEFVDRCMGDSEAVGDFPDSGQRFAVCNSIFTDSRKVAEAVRDGG